MPRLLPFLVLLLLPASVFAQRPEPAESLRFIQAWHTQQQRIAAPMRVVVFTERAQQEIDSPRGVRSSETDVRNRFGLDDGHLDRVPLRTVIDGKVLSGEDVVNWERRRAHMLRPFHEASRWLLAPPVYLMRHVHPVSPPQPDPLRRQPATRIEFRADAENTPIDRLTAWFTPDGRRLLRTRILYQLSPDAPPLQVTTDYAPIEGLDLPERQWLDGMLKYRRRTRTYTVLLDVDARFTDYRFERR